MDSSVLDLLKRSAAIPSMPQVATRFLEIIQDPEFDFRELATVLSTDPGTASEVLRLANSSLFGVARQITSLSQAMALLGLKRVRSLVLGRYIVDSIDQKGLASIDGSYYWRRSLCTAVLAARLADALAPKLCEEAFISGLLADVGVVVLDEAIPDAYRPIAEKYCPHGKIDLANDEQTLLGITHGQASAVVLDHWQLPEVVCEAVRWHPWETVDDQTESLARILGAADRIGKYLCETSDRFEQVAADCREILSRLNLEPTVLASILEDLELQIEEFASVLRINVIPSSVYPLLANALKDQLAKADPAAI